MLRRLRRAQGANDRKTLVLLAAERHGSMVLKIAAKRLDSRDAADDVFQEVFSALYLSARTFKDEDHLKHWLIRATINKCNDVHRRRKRVPEMPVDPAGPALQSLVADDDGWPFGEKYGDDELWEQIGHLNENLQLTVKLFYVEGYSTEEIAEMTNVSPVTVRTRLNRARNQLRKALTEGGEDGCE